MDNPPVRPHDWLALRVRSNFERRVSTNLNSDEVETFLPTYLERRTWSDREKEIETPLFRGYVFCRMSLSYKLYVEKTPGVIGFISVGRTPAYIPDSEIENIRKFLRSGLNPHPAPYPKVGERVRIQVGPLAGIEGVLQEIKTGYRFVVVIELLKRSVAAEIDRDSIRSLPSVRPHNCNAATL